MSELKAHKKWLHKPHGREPADFSETDFSGIVITKERSFRLVKLCAKDAGGKIISAARFDKQTDLRKLEAQVEDFSNVDITTIARDKLPERGEPDKLRALWDRQMAAKKALPQTIPDAPPPTDDSPPKSWGRDRPHKKPPGLPSK